MHAQPIAPAAFDKSEAILGGPSSLAAILAAQSTSAPVQTIASLPMRYAIARPATVSPLATFVDAEPIDLAASPTRPDIFNSVAIAVARTPLDGRWSRVESTDIGGHADRFATALRGHDERTRLDAVNAYVNARVTFTDDGRQYGVPDRWSTARDTLARGRGDCEDYALAKMAMLRRAGIADRNLYFVVLKDLVRRADHAVLIVRSQGRFIVLDNGTDRLIDSAMVRDYRPVLTFSAGQRFTHGYRRSPAPRVIMASNGAARDPRLGTIATSGMPSSPFASR
ncbi:MAG: transglutaminase-like cysteine peptidase [Pseudomonadota bacterium]|nr:transglutaminase-like cysteine peptidase [Pseudomonadota bacterium]